MVTLSSTGDGIVMKSVLGSMRGGNCAKDKQDHCIHRIAKRSGLVMPLDRWISCQQAGNVIRIRNHTEAVNGIIDVAKH